MPQSPEDHLPRSGFGLHLKVLVEEEVDDPKQWPQ